MRFNQIKPLTEEQLDELRMNPGSLKQFVSSPEAQGIMAGFEAELVFTGLGDSDGGDLEPDYDYDERTRGYSIDGIVEFFEYDEWGYGISPRQARELRDSLDESYMEWFDGKMYDAFRDERDELVKEAIEEDWDWDEQTEEYLNNMGLSDDEVQEALEAGENAGTFNSSAEQEAYAYENPGYQRYLEAREQAEEGLDALVEQEIEEQGKYYDEALDNFRDNFTIDDDELFFDDIGYRYMSDIANAFDITWPYLTGGGGEGGFSEDNAERLADDLHEKLGVQTKVSSGYHSATRKPGLWIFEPDSSLDADDSDNMPVEIVSPPMPLEECLAKMAQFFEWAEDNGAYANSSTGFHMGVSLPHTGGRVDYVKLALFLGDEHVLQQFGRASNTYCTAAMKKIRDRIKGNKETIGSALELMRHNLLELAQKSLQINNHGFGKYTSINPQGGNDATRPDQERGAKYIEFRSAGGSNYFEDISKLQNTLMRYAKAMSVAANPAAERREYYKKLYKLISPPEGDPAIDLFARFATGEISSTELKTQWAEKALAKDAPELVQKGDWVVINTNTNTPATGQEYRGFSRDEVRKRAKEKLLNNPSAPSANADFDKWYKIVPIETGKWEIYKKNPDGTEETLEIVDADRRGEAVDKVYDKYSSQGVGFYARPYYGDGSEQPTKPLTRRAELAKNIKNAPAEPIQNWIVYDTLTGEEHYNQPGRKSNLVQIMRKMEQDHKWPRGRLAIKLSPDQPESDEEKLAKLHKELGLTSDEPEQQTYSNYADAQRAADQQNSTPSVTDVAPDVAQNFEQPNYAIYMRRYPSSPIVQFHANDVQDAQAKLDQYISRTRHDPNDYFIGPLS